jgi:HAE1 family hydrophobic/amphiphilic exporter-1
MKISEPFVRRPIATWLLAGALLAVGIVSYLRLPVSALPEVDFPTLQVSANLPGASPETMASNVATPLERQFSLIPGISEMTSATSLGVTQITLQFALARNIDGAAQDVQAAMNAAGGQLPTNLPSPPTVRKVNPADVPVLVLMLTSETLPLRTLSDYVDSLLAQQLSRIEGVGQVEIGGAVKPAVRIRLDPRKAAELGLQLDAVRAQIAANTVNAPKGTLIGQQQSYTVYANDQVFDTTAWNQMIAGYHNGAPVRIRDLGARSRVSRMIRPGPGRFRAAPTPTRATRPARRSNSSSTRSPAPTSSRRSSG